MIRASAFAAVRVRPSNLANHVNNSGASDLDDVAGMNPGIAARIIGLEKIFQVHLHGILGYGSIAFEARGHLPHLESVLRAGGRLICCGGTICGWLWFCGQSRTS